MRQTIGEWRGVTLEVAAWDSVMAEVDLSFSCMFTQELGDDGPVGGLAHLDTALGGMLTALRRAGNFRGELLETLLIDHPPLGITARTVMVIGLGDPRTWTPERSGQAAAAAVRNALQRQVRSAAFAPSVLDAGISTASTGLPAAMLRAVAAALDTQMRVVQTGFAASPLLRQWVFDVGAARFDGAVASFTAELAALAAGNGD